MKRRKESSLTDEGFLLLLEGSLSSIPFNILVATLLGVNLLYNDVPLQLIGPWLTLIYFLSVTRWIYSKISIKTGYYHHNLHASAALFVILTGCMGLSWSLCYFLFLPYITGIYEGLVIIYLGGIAAGAIASLSVYLPAYLTYLITIFLPLIAYNVYLFHMDKIMLGILYLVFVVVLFVAARINSQLLHMTVTLDKEKDVLINELTLINLKLEKSIGEVRELSITDSLTGLFNRRYFDMILNKELDRAKRENHSINLVFIDIDNFKYINDTFGHPSGDDFLVFVANALKESMQRPADTIFRLGGDEFAAILSNMHPEDAVNFCFYIKEVFNKDNAHKNVTLSMGIISISALNLIDQQSIITAADKILYQAKKAGKNKILSKSIA